MQVPPLVVSHFAPVVASVVESSVPGGMVAAPAAAAATAADGGGAGAATAAATTAPRAVPALSLRPLNRLARRHHHVARPARAVVLRASDGNVVSYFPPYQTWSRSR